MRSRLCVVSALALGLSACAHRHPGEPPTASTQARALPDSELTPRDAFTCASGQNLATQYDSTQRKLALSVDRQLVRLDQVPTGSGAKFSNGSVTFWSNGPVALLVVDGVRTDCERTLGR